MKKLFVLLLSVFVVMNVFAATGEAVNVDSTLTLELENQYKFAFIASTDITSETLSEFILHTKGDALTFSRDKTTLELDEARNVFYFYYQAYTNRGDLKIKISAPNNLVKDDDPSQTIPYTASFEPVSKNWDGGTLSLSSITSGSVTASAASADIIKDLNNPGDYNYMGLCKVTIDSAEDLGKKKPGNYSAKIYLTLTAN